MSSCQIAFAYGDQSEQIAVVSFDKNVANPFAALQASGSKLFSGNPIIPSSIYFVYQDEDGDFVTVASDADALEAFAIYEDAGQDSILLSVKVNSPSPAPVAAKSDDDLASDTEVKEDAPQDGAHNFLDENFVLEFASFLSDPAVRSVIPEVCANLAAAVLRKASAQELYEIAVSNAVLKQKSLLNQEWPFAKSWAAAFDQWISNLTEDQLGKVAFQIPIIAGRLVAKREKLHKAIFVKHRRLGRLLSISQFDFGSVDLSELMETASKGAGEKTAGHVGTVCAVCAASPIQGTRYRCMVCPSFDVCENCEATAGHPADHAMMKFRSSKAGFIGMNYASALYGKKAVKHQLKALKHEAKLAWKAEKAEAKLTKKSEKYGRHHRKPHEMPPEYAPPKSFAAAAGAPPKRPY